MKENILLDKQGKKYLVKRLTVSDAKFLSAFLQSLSNKSVELFKPHPFDTIFIRNLLKNKKDIRIGISLKGKIVGYAFANKLPFTNIAYFGIGISEKYQGRGLGHKLMDSLFETCKKENFDKIILNVYGKNLKAMELYKKHGFKPIKISKFNYYLITAYETIKNNYILDLIKVLFDGQKTQKSKIVWMVKYI